MGAGSEEPSPQVSGEGYRQGELALCHTNSSFRGKVGSNPVTTGKALLKALLANSFNCTRQSRPSPQQINSCHRRH